MIQVYQVTYDSTSGNGNVPAVADRRLYEHLLLSDVGVVEGVNVSASGTNLIVSSGWGVIKGAVFQVEQETIQAQVPASGSVTGRLLIQLNVTNSTIEFVTQAENPLPALVQEDINTNGSIYQMPLATYTISTASISNLSMVYDTLESVGEFKAGFDAVANTVDTMNSKLATIERGAQVNTVTGVKGTKESSYRTGNVSLTPANIGAVPTTRTVNGKELSSNITITQSDIGLSGVNPVVSDTSALEGPHQYLRGNWSTFPTGFSIVVWTQDASTNKRYTLLITKISETTGYAFIFAPNLLTTGSDPSLELMVWSKSGSTYWLNTFYSDQRSNPA